MTNRELYRQGKALLQQAGVEDCSLDADLLFERACGLPRAKRIVQGEASADAAAGAEFMRMVRERAQRRPLQYILGEWEFMGLPFFVGEGVLCPRPETELLVRAAAQALAGRLKLRAVDLCAGSGAVAVGLASLLPNAEIVCVEQVGDAFDYLCRNLERLQFPRICARRADVLSPFTASAIGNLDAVVSNPPYVARRELHTLQQEVQREPVTALDGGEDGLLFYRAIARLWIPRLLPGGVAAVEIGETQGAAVRFLFEEAGLIQVQVIKDLSGLDRVVLGVKSPA